MGDALDSYLDAEIRSTLLSRRYPVKIRLGPDQIRELVNESVSLRITVRGQGLPIFEAYRTAHPEAVPLYPLLGYASPQPAVTRRALVHMRAYKRAYGISHYDGIPIEVAAGPCIQVVSKAWPA